MTDHRWQRLKALFQTAAELPVAERERFLARECGEDIELRQQAEALLAAHDGVDDFLETPAFVPPLGAETVEPLAVGEVVDNTYLVQRRLGAGGMGVVYQVLHQSLGRVFALKVIGAVAGDRDDFVRRFRAEAEALGRLKHPNIVDVTDFGVDEMRGLPYLVMEYLEGESLADLLSVRGSLPAEEGLPLLREVAAALDHAHSVGVLHRDLKPANVFVCASTPPVVKLVDFGLAGFIGAVADGPLRGTPGYIAPELMRGQSASRASDIYAFGVLAHEVLTGELPSEKVDRVAAAARPAYDPQPGNRPSSAAAAWAALQSFFTAEQRRAWRMAELPRRGLAAAAIGIAATLLLPRVQALPMTERLELPLIDSRFAMTSRPVDPRILLLVIDEKTLSAETTPIGARGDEVGTRLQQVFAAGARSVALDFLLPESWGGSQPFVELVLRHRDALTLGVYSTSTGEVVGPESLAGFTAAALGPAASTLFGFVNTEQDLDGVTRRASTAYLDTSGTPRPALASRLVKTAGLSEHGDRPARFWLDASVRASDFDRLSWSDVDEKLQTAPTFFRDRLVLVGADYAASGDEVRLPHNVVAPGVAVHALAAHTLLNDLPIQDVSPRFAMIAAWLLTSLAAAAVLCLQRMRWLPGTMAAIIVGYTLVAFGAFLVSGAMLPVTAPLAVMVAAALAAAGIRRFRPAFPIEVGERTYAVPARVAPLSTQEVR